MNILQRPPNNVIPEFSFICVIFIELESGFYGWNILKYKDSNKTMNEGKQVIHIIVL